MPEQSKHYTDKAIDLQGWSKMQGLLAGITGSTLTIYEETGQGYASISDRPRCAEHGHPCVSSSPLVPASNESPFCTALRERPKGHTLCDNYCNRSMKRALELGTTLTFQCYAGLINFAIPVTLDASHHVVLLGGRIFDTPLTDEFIAELASHVDMTPEELKTLTDMTPVKPVNLFQKDVESLEGLAQYVLQSGFERNVIQNNASRLRALLNVGMDLSVRSSREEVLKLFLSSLEFLYGVQDASVMLFDAGSRYYKTAASVGPLGEAAEAYHCAADEGLAAKVLEYRSPTYINNTFDLLKAGLPEEIYSCFTFPIQEGEKVAGIINIFNVELAQDDLPILTAFCRYLQTAITNASLRDSIRVQMDTLFAVTEACSALCGDAPTEQLFNTILDKAASLMKAEQGSLMLFNEEAKGLVIKATKGFNEKLVEHFRIQPGEGIAGKVLESGKPLIVSDIATDPRLSGRKRQRYKTGSFMSMPLSWKKSPMGVLNLADKADGSSFCEEDLSLMNLVAAQAAMAIDRARLQEKTEELRKLAVTDPLTGLFSRRYLEEVLYEEVERTLRYSRPLSLIMIDLDNFKPYNDSYGHQAGDELLKEVGRVLHGAVRSIDAAVRYGGDEFAVILPETGAEGALNIAHRIMKDMNSSIIWKQKKNKVVEKEYAFEAGQKSSGEIVEIHLSLSMGIAAVPGDARSVKELITKADKALYAAKARGKNRVEFYSSFVLPPPGNS
ncbi:MAG: diguanylate cyclase [Nitrospirota bacterium]|nr:diguanylate cyclase [Nitrospirota bacterium]